MTANVSMSEMNRSPGSLFLRPEHEMHLGDMTSLDLGLHSTDDDPEHIIFIFFSFFRLLCMYNFMLYHLVLVVHSFTVAYVLIFAIRHLFFDSSHSTLLFRHLYITVPRSRWCTYPSSRQKSHKWIEIQCSTSTPTTTCEELAFLKIPRIASSIRTCTFLGCHD